MMVGWVEAILMHPGMFTYLLYVPCCIATRAVGRASSSDRNVRPLLNEDLFPVQWKDKMVVRQYSIQGIGKGPTMCTSRIKTVPHQATLY